MGSGPVSLDDLRVLLALHRHGSFLAAGSAMGMATSTVARRVRLLEEALGRPLVHRTSSGTTVEPDASEVVALAEQMEHGLEALRRSPAADASAPQGTVRVSVGEGFAAAVAKVLFDLRRRHPQLTFELAVEARLADLAAREADVGLRTTRSASKVLVERSLGAMRFGLYAAHEYVDKRVHGPRLERADFARLDFIGFDGALRRSPQQAFLDAQGAARFAFRTNSDQAMLEAARAGQGIAVLAQLAGGAEPGLRELQADAPLPVLPLRLVYHRDLRALPRLRVTLAALEAALSPRLKARPP